MQLTLAIMVLVAGLAIAYGITSRTDARRAEKLYEEAAVELSEKDQKIAELLRDRECLSNVVENVRKARDQDLQAARKRERMLIHRAEYAEKSIQKIATTAKQYKILPPL